MIVNIVSLLVLVLLVVLFAWLAARAWRAKRAFVKWPGVILAGLLTLVFAAVTVVAVLGFVKLEARHTNPVADLKVAGTAEQIARGGQLAWGCADCHSPALDLPLGGSTENFIAGGPPMGVLFATNLTPGGPLKDWTDGEIVRAIREGVDEDGRPLIAMPSQAYRHLSDADVQALVAYLRSQPAVDNPQPARNLNIAGRALPGRGPVPYQRAGARGFGGRAAGRSHRGVRRVPGIIHWRLRRLPRRQAGRRPPQPVAPPAPPLKPFAAGMSEAQFMAVFREGRRMDGSPVAEGMPWKNIGKTMSDDDLRAVQAYLKTLP